MNSMQGREQIENAIRAFPNIIPDDINLSPFMDDETVHRIKRADQYKEKLLGLIHGNGEAGDATPWKSTAGKFVFREAELTVWSGFKGHGKSIVISQVFENFISNEKKVLIISPEFPPHRVLYRMLIQSLTKAGLNDYSASNWLEAVKNNLWIYDQQSSLRSGDIPALCRYAVKHFGVQHILLDSLMKMGINSDDYAGQKRFTDQIQQVAHKTGAHIHLVAHQKKGESDREVGGLHGVKGASEIADLAENVIIVWRNKEKEFGVTSQLLGPDCILKVEAQRNADGWIGKIPLYFNKTDFTFHEA